MKTTQDIKTAVAASKVKSAWTKGVRRTALDLLDSLEGDYSQAALLNGAENWQAWSYGGCGLIYDADIAQVFCSPSELRRVRGGDRQPSAQESWLDLQARAAGQAARLIARAAK